MPVPTLARSKQLVRRMKLRKVRRRLRGKREANASSSYGSLLRPAVQSIKIPPNMQEHRKDLFRWTPLREAQVVSQPPDRKKQRVYLVTVIAEGLGNRHDMNFYSKEALESAPEKFNGAKCFSDHPDLVEERILPERSIADMVGYYTDCFTDKGSDGRTRLRGYLHVFPNQESLTSKIDCILQDPKAKDLFGISIYAEGDTEPRQIDGKNVHWVKSFERVTSADIVTEPAARGRFDRIVESMQGTREKTPTGWEGTVKALKKHSDKIDNPWALCLSGKTTIPCLDGVVRTIREIADSKEDVWLYGFDSEEHLVVPALARVRYVGPRPAWEVVLDNNKKIVCSSEHRWVRRDGSFVETRHLRLGDSLMPFKTIICKNGGHERVYQPGLGCYSPTHWAVMRVLEPSGCAGGKYLIHHKNGKERDNSPDNLEWKSRLAHDRMHFAEKYEKMRAAYDEKFAFNPEFRQRLVETGRRAAKKQWCDPNYREKMTSILRAQAHAAGVKAGKVHHQKRLERLRAANHKVKSVRFLRAFVPMYDVAVDGVHTFAISSGVFSHNSWWMRSQGYTPHKENGKVISPQGGIFSVVEVAQLYARKRELLQESRRHLKRLLENRKVQRAITGVLEKGHTFSRMREAVRQLTRKQVKTLADDLTSALQSNSDDQLRIVAKKVIDELYAVSVGDTLNLDDVAISQKGDVNEMKMSKKEAKRKKEAAKRGKETAGLTKKMTYSETVLPREEDDEEDDEEEADIPPRGLKKVLGGDMDMVPKDAADKGVDINPDLDDYEEGYDDEEDDEEEAGYVPPTPKAKDAVPSDGDDDDDDDDDDEAYGSPAMEMAGDDDDMYDDDDMDDDDDDNDGGQYNEKGYREMGRYDEKAYREARERYLEMKRQREMYLRSKESHKKSKETRRKKEDAAGAGANDAVAKYNAPFKQTESRKNALREAKRFRRMAVHFKKLSESRGSRLKAMKRQIFLAGTANSARKLLREAQRPENKLFDGNVMPHGVVEYLYPQLIGLVPEDQKAEIRRHIQLVEGIKSSGEDSLIDGMAARGGSLQESAGDSSGKSVDLLEQYGIPTRQLDEDEE